MPAGVGTYQPQRTERFSHKRQWHAWMVERSWADAFQNPARRDPQKRCHREDGDRQGRIPVAFPIAPRLPQHAQPLRRFGDRQTLQAPGEGDTSSHRVIMCAVIGGVVVHDRSWRPALGPPCPQKCVKRKCMNSDVVAMRQERAVPLGCKPIAGSDRSKSIRWSAGRDRHSIIGGGQASCCSPPRQPCDYFAASAFFSQPSTSVLCASIHSVA